MLKPLKYIDIFGTKLTSTDRNLPTLYTPGATGWISYAQTDLATYWSEGSDELVLLSMLSEKTFQELFGKRRVPTTYSIINENYAAYELTETQAKKFLMDEVEYFIKERMPEWVRMMNAFYSEYNPIENYDRYEEGTISDEGSRDITLTKEGSEIMEKSGKEVQTPSGSEILTMAGKEIETPTGSEAVTTENNYNGYNSSTSVPVSDSTSTTSFDQRKTEKSFDQRTDTTSFNQRKDELSFDQRKDTLSFDERTDTTGETNGNTRTLDTHTHGNIGVTTTQQMIESELKLRERDMIIQFHREIANRFLLSVY